VSALGAGAREGGTDAKESEALSSSDHNNIATCKEISEAQWLAIAKWGQESDSLAEWQRGLARSLAGYAAEKWRKDPSRKQGKHGALMVQLARQAGILGSH
jgi:hypothetical protein